MRWGATACAIALSLTGSGCALVADSAHATSYWTHQAIQDTHERKRNRKLATIAWDEMRAAHPDASCDFEEGFKEGFADHLYRGTTQPPPVPPKQYRELKNQTTAGFRAGEDWLVGFRLGTEAAQASGLRVLVTGPSSVGHDAIPTPAPQPPAERLPLPRPANPAPAIEKLISIPSFKPESLRMPGPMPIIPPVTVSPTKLEAPEYIVPPKDLQGGTVLPAGASPAPELRQQRTPDFPRFALPGFVAGRFQGSGSELVMKLQSRREPPGGTGLPAGTREAAPPRPAVVQVSFEQPHEIDRLPLVLSVSPALSQLRGEKPWWIVTPAKKLEQVVPVTWVPASTNPQAVSAALWVPLPIDRGVQR